MASDPLLRDLTVYDTEGTRWAVIQRWLEEIVATYSGGGGGGGGTGMLISTLVYFGTATLNDVFGFFEAPAAVTIRRIQISAQTTPISDINITLVNAAGVSYGAIGILAAGTSYAQTVLGAPLVLAPGDIVMAKLTAVDGTGGYLTVNLL